jgi:hypothetical protein
MHDGIGYLKIKLPHRNEKSFGGKEATHFSEDLLEPSHHKGLVVAIDFLIASKIKGLGFRSFEENAHIFHRAVIAGPGAFRKKKKIFFACAITDESLLVIDIRGVPIRIRRVTKEHGERGHD